ncbi:MAG TPA: GNAT family protein [Candidatus Dormibacteraeota bacterium]|nr:GNAT family protein [Candidatus Dormibacteraeota bacterium]
MRTGIATMTDTVSEARTAGDGRHWTLRPARPTDARALSRLFAAVRGEGRWLVTPPAAVSEPSEAFYIGEMIRGGDGLTLVAEADGEVVGNLLVSLDRNVVSEHIGTLSICVAADWRDVGIGSAMVEAGVAWARDRGLAKMALGVFPDNERAIAVYERAGFVREGVRRRQYRGPNGTFRDELLMAWFPDGQEADR